jgi:hypothetical protein
MLEVIFVSQPFLQNGNSMANKKNLMKGREEVFGEYYIFNRKTNSGILYKASKRDSMRQSKKDSKKNRQNPSTNNTSNQSIQSLEGGTQVEAFLNLMWPQYIIKAEKHCSNT